jgi:hypothetical protein
VPVEGVVPVIASKLEPKLHRETLSSDLATEHPHI